MGETLGRARSWGFTLPVLLAFVALSLVVALAARAVNADHAGPHVKLVLSDDASVDLAIDPLTLNVGDVVSIDLMVQFPDPADTLYAAEFHMIGSGDLGAVRVIDASPETPGLQFQVVGAALSDKEQLRLPIVGVPTDGDDLRPCAVDPNPPADPGDIYTFVKGATGDDTNVELQLLESGDGWCGPTAAGISLAWFAETNPAYASLIPGTPIDAIHELGMLMGAPAQMAPPTTTSSTE